MEKRGSEIVIDKFKSLINMAFTNNFKKYIAPELSVTPYKLIATPWLKNILL